MPYPVAGALDPLAVEITKNRNGEREQPCNVSTSEEEVKLDTKANKLSNTHVKYTKRKHI